MSKPLPERVDLGRLFSFSMDHMFCSDRHGEGERLFRFVLPPFQRPPVWTQKQNISFMESVILGLPIGTYTYCQSIDKPKTDGWLIDGQQRMRAIKGFLDDEFSVFDNRWKDLENRDRLRIRNTVFPAYVLNDASEEECLERYIKLNYSGTAHTKADKQRALKSRGKM